VRGRNWVAVMGTVLVILGCACDTALAGTPYKATVRRTAYGIPHIEAKNYQGLGYGYGYSIAQDNICVLAETYATVDGERARWFGPNGSYQQRGNGVEANNLDSDFFFQQIIDSKQIDKLLAQPPPNGIEPAGRQVVRGYVAGYNKYLSDVGGANGVRDPACKGKPWVRPIGEAEAYRRFYQLSLLASADVAIPGIARAQPPTPQTGVPGGVLPTLPLGTEATARGLAEKLPIKAAGSNAVAVGRQGTRDGKHGLLLGNPHFPWVGPERFYQAHATIPGKLDVEGGSLFGVPAVLIGHTKTMAWSHTVSTAFRFTPYQLTLVPGSPTTFVRDGQPVEMTSRDVTVQVPADGNACADAGCPVKPSTRRLYTAPGIGPVFNELVGIPLPWTSSTAFAMRDANANNFRVFNHFFATNKAKSAKEELQILERYQGIPWVNTIVADKSGDALYADIGAIPNVSNAKAADCNTALGTATFQLLGLPVLDASRGACDWDTDPDAREPGLFGASKMPRLMRSDFVTNSNDSYWLSNPKHPLQGFARIIGDERTARSLRTRIGLLMTQARTDGSDHLGPPGFTRQDMQNMVFSDRQYGGELTRDDAVAMCRSFPGGNAPSSNGPVPVGNACDVLAAWDLHENLGSRGAILFRRFIGRAMAANSSPFATPFDPDDPVQTPNGLNTGNPEVQRAFGDAIADLNGAGIKLDAAPGDVQFTTRGDRKIPIHGGPGDPNGQFNAISAPFVPGKGFTDIQHGSSFVQVVTWNKSACPDSRTILTYSESTDPTSQHYADQTDLFSRKRWVRDLFCRKDVLRGTKSTTKLARGKKTKTAVRRK
jgi:acyl-homoserine-lactone acylase